MRQAYINNMLSRRDLQQAMVAQGFNGGATETTRANMENNYGNARNSIDTTRNKNLAELAAQYSNNLAGLRQQLNSGYSDLDTQKLNYSMQINDKLQSMLSDYSDKITNFLNDTYKAYERGEASLIDLVKAAYIAEEGDKAFDSYNGAEGAAALTSTPTSYINQLNNIAADLNKYTLAPAQVTNPQDTYSMQQIGQFANSNYAKYLAAQNLLANNKQSALNNAQLGNNGNVSSLAQVLKALYGV